MGVIRSVFMLVCAVVFAAACGSEEKPQLKKDWEPFGNGEKAAPATKTIPKKSEKEAPVKNPIATPEADPAADDAELEAKAPIPEAEPKKDESPATEPETEIADAQLEEPEGLFIKSLVLGNGIEVDGKKKKPMNQGKTFSIADTEKVVVFLSVANPPEVETELEVSFLAPGAEKERGKVSVSIPAQKKWTTRAYHRIKRPAGLWEVIVRHEDSVIARAKFEMTE